MIKSKIIKLINRQLDGELSEKEAAQLSQYLKQDQEMQQFFNEQERMISYLNAVPEVDPPSDLKETIISGITEPANPESGKNKIPVFEIQSWFTRNRLRIIISHAALLIIGFSLSAYLIHPSQPQRVLDISQLSGTIGLEQENLVEPDFGQTYNLKIYSGQIDLKQNQTQVWITFKISPEMVFKTQLIYDASQLHFQVFMPSRTENISLQTTENILSISASGSFILLFKRIINQKSEVQIEIGNVQLGSERFELVVNQQ